MGNVSTNVYAKFCCVPLHIKKALGIFRELITTRRTTRVAFWDPPSGSKNKFAQYNTDSQTVIHQKTSKTERQTTFTWHSITV